MTRRLMSENNPKVVYSVSETARSVGLSRSHFYTLVRQGFFPMPVYDLRSKRPYYPAELQQVCLQVRQTGMGHNGLPALFYSPRQAADDPAVKTSKSPGKRRETALDPAVQELTEALLNLGIRDVAEEQVAEALGSLYPDRPPQGMDHGLLLRQLFRHFQQRERHE